VPEFNAGAMENPGAVTFSEMFVFRSRTTDDKRRQRAMVVAHEMSHMWFGDLVTMRWWDDLWLNESFAELMGFLTVDRATRFEDTWVDFSTSRKAWGYRADQLPSTHPVQGDVPDNRSALLNFDGISYAKGACVLRQLMATVGEEAFFAGVRAYLERHAFSNTSFADLLVELEAASGRDLGQWSWAWLQTSGVSTLRTVVDGRVGLRQESDVLRPHRVGVGLYELSGAGPEAGLVLRDRLDLQLPGADLTLDLDPADLPALLLPNDGDLTFAKVRFDDSSLATVLADLRRLADPLARALCWAALWDACRDAELRAEDFVAAVLRGVDAEPDPAVVATLLEQARTAAELYAPDGTALLDALAGASGAAAWAAPPGGDLQLVRLRAFAAAARGPVHVPAVAAVLDGSAVPPGAAVDAELRWHLVECLAALGEMGEEEIAAELARDDTAAGRLHALTARASLPDADAKRRVWESVTGDASLSNHESGALAAGFWRCGQDELLRPYVDRYVSELPALWDARTPQVAGTLAQRLFPSTLVAQDVLDRTAVLEDAAHPAGLRRYVAERRDDLSRALRARERAAAAGGEAAKG
jgi:aminopeptidase N